MKFLTEIEFDEFEMSLKKLLKRDYKIEERMRLACGLCCSDRFLFSPPRRRVPTLLE